MSDSMWGYRKESFLFEAHAATVVFPKEGTACGRLALKTEYRDAFPEAVEIPLLQKGFHLCFIENDNRWGTAPDLERKARFVRHIAERYHLSAACVPVGMSCGGLIAIKFAASYPELVSCLYLDAPVVNYMSCPCGFGDGVALGDGSGIPEILAALQLPDLAHLLAYRDMPLDRLPALLRAGIPAVMVAGDADRTVPYHENGIFVTQAYRNAGIAFLELIKPGCDHHPHGMPDPTPVVDFIWEHMHDK